MQFSQLGPYLVVKKLGRGGMGTVFEAIHSDTGETVAVKVLATALAEEKDARARFAAEIESLKRLDHPNIVRLLAYGEQDGHAYYVMELVDGTTLESELQAGRQFTWREVTQMGIQLCRALRHAHDRGIIHRDIKPANLLVTAGGDVKLSDFGIARLFGMTGVTSHGGIVGTAEYMAPEQAEGRPVSPQSDLYSLGCVLFTLMAGRTPFRGSSVTEMLQLQRFETPPPLSDFAPHAPVALEEIIGTLLEKSPEDRIPNAAILGRQLQELEDAMSDLSDDDSFDDPPTRVGDTNIAQREEPRSLSDPLAPTRITQTEPVLSKGAHPSREKRPAQRTSGKTEVGNRTSGTATNRHITVAPPGRVVLRPSRWKKVRQGLQVAMPAFGLMALIAVVWYFMMPPSADRLVARIEAIAAENDPERMLDTEEDLRDFLDRFPQDPRAAKMKVYLDEVELERFDRRLRLLSALPGKDHDLPPAAMELLAAIRLTSTEPTAALTKLQALVALYENEPNVGQQTRQAVALARRRIARLQEDVTASSVERSVWLNEQLDKADALAQKEPAAALSIWQGVVALYGERPWASEQVQRARQRIESAHPAAPEPVEQPEQ